MLSKGWSVLLCTLLLGEWVTNASSANKQPNIVFILSDDQGYNDVGFHGNNVVKTPNIDALCSDGIILNKYYVNSLCTPSRSELMTGKYAIRTGMQHFVLYGAEARGLPLNEKLLPEYLNDLGYTSHMVGKWHLGSFKKRFTPLYRGFKSHLGFWTGRHDFFDHTACENGTWGLDMRRGFEPAYDLQGEYSTDVFTRKAEAIIAEHDTSNPLFLYLSHAAMHSGNNYSPIPVDENLAATMFANIPDYHRRRYAVALYLLDQSVGRVVAALVKKGIFENTLIVYSTDNGGPAAGFNINAASNYPLKGVKNSLWEGGVRGAGCVWSTKFQNPGRSYDHLMHITDWLPTLFTAAGGQWNNRSPAHSPQLNSSYKRPPILSQVIPSYYSRENAVSQIDGENIWESLVNDTPNNRSMLLHNIDSIDGNSALRYNQWKYLNGTSYGGIVDGWFGPAERNQTYDVASVENSTVSQALLTIGRSSSANKILELREKSTPRCPIQNGTACNTLVGKACLFDIEQDPCERDNVAARFPEVLRDLELMLRKVNATGIRPQNLTPDPRGNADRWNHVWTNFGDELGLADYTPPSEIPPPVTLSVFDCNVNHGRIE